MGHLLMLDNYPLTTLNNILRLSVSLGTTYNLLQCMSQQWNTLAHSSHHNLVYNQQAIGLIRPITCHQVAPKPLRLCRLSYSISILSVITCIKDLLGTQGI